MKARGCTILLATGVLAALSCTRMPTAPRSEITVVGRVIGPSSEPLPWTYLIFNPGEAALEDYTDTVTDSLGNYSVRLISGRYRVEIEPPSSYGFMPRTEQVTVSDRHSRLDFAFRGHRVTGRVLEPTGNLLETGRVVAYLRGQGSAGSYFEHGSYSLLLPTGRYSFEAWPADYLSGFSPERQESVQIVADTTIDFQLGGIMISGRVFGPDGLPMKDVTVQARGDGYVQNRTTTGGDYRLYVPSGTYRLWFGAPYPFLIIPRVVGPLAITVPTSIDGDLSGVEWTGTVRRIGTNDPAPGIPVRVRMVEDEYERGVSTYTGPQGVFRFILEADRRYDLSTYDPAVGEFGEWVVRLQGAMATADTTLEIFLPSPMSP